MTDRVEERGLASLREVTNLYRVTLDRISVWLESKGAPRSEEYVDALDRLFGEQQSEIQRLRKVEEAAREYAGCDTVHIGYPPGFTCIDYREQARTQLGTFAADYRARLLRNEHLCRGCRLAEILGENFSVTAESSKTLEPNTDPVREGK